MNKSVEGSGLGAGPEQASSAPSSSAGGSAPPEAHEVKSLGATHSLRQRLLWSVLAAILLIAVLQAITAYRGALRQADAMFDDHLQQVARSMRAGAPLGVPPEAGIAGAEFDLYVQIWGPDGTQLFRSGRSDLPPRAVLGFSDVEANGSRYRVYSLQTPLQTVQIAQDLSARADRAQALAVRALLPFALLTPLLMLAVWWVINRSLAPVERARRQLARRAADDFSALDSDDLPDEVRPLVDELNLLFGRVRDAFATQRNFVADAAHELRSPLTALKLQAQALRRPEEDPAAREAGVVRLNQGIDRAIRLVEQLLVLAREEASAGQPTVEDLVDLREVIKLAVSDVLPLAAQKEIDLGLTGSQPTQPVWAAGQSEALRMMLRNLLDNAVKYTPRSGRVDMTLELESAAIAQGDHKNSARLVIEDSGPGIAPEDQARVFNRFVRTSQATAEPGSGLGLAIANVIAVRHGATIVLGSSSRLGGLKAELSFPLAAPHSGS